MPQPPSVIRCPRCGHEPNILADICINCGAQLEKLCGLCGFSNAVEKNYCDQCGSLLMMKPAAHEQKTGAEEGAKPFFAAPDNSRPAPPPRAPLEMQPILDTVNERDVSYRNRKKAEISAAPAAQASLTRRTIRLVSLLKKCRPVLFWLTAAAALAAAAYFLAKPLLPGFTLKRTAAGYLEKLSSGRYREAYDLLSTNSKAACSADEFIKRSREYYAENPRWQFRDVEIFIMNKNTAMIKYQLKENDKPWQTDYISFVKENDIWARPYIWTLFEPLDAALAAQDYPQALFLAQKLYLTDPIDPRTSGYLCAAEFFMGLYDKAEQSCLDTLNASKTYPVGFTREEIFWYRFYYAESLRFLEKYESAIEEYNNLFAGGDLTRDDECRLYITRSDALVRLLKYDAALDDVLKADATCRENTDKKELTQRLRFLNGDAKAEAISFVQRSRLSPDQPPILEMRRRRLAEAAAKPGAKKAKFQARDSWLSAHIAGPEYRVILREKTLNPGGAEDTREAMVFSVNLWTARAKLIKGQAQDK